MSMSENTISSVLSTQTGPNACIPLTGGSATTWMIWFSSGGILAQAGRRKRWPRGVVSGRRRRARDGGTTLWTCDFSDDYVKINAEYRSGISQLKSQRFGIASTLAVAG